LAAFDATQFSLGSSVSHFRPQTSVVGSVVVEPSEMLLPFFFLLDSPPGVAVLGFWVASSVSAGCRRLLSIRRPSASALF